jgi:predicted alpha/beta superfamily hydrolase
MHKLIFFRLRPLFLFLFLLPCSVSLQAQQRVTLVVKSLPSYHRASDPIYLAGSFNNWNPGHESWKLKTLNGKPGITIEVPKGMIEFKLTKGNWQKVESGEEGGQIGNRRMMIEGDTTVELDIQHWADHFPQRTRKSTAGKNVRIIDTAFYMPQLNRHRRIWIYLPESYATSRKKYPVLYMHDAQNLFDDASSFSGEWGIDEALDTLGKSMDECIVVGIDNGGEKRLNEYSPYDMERYGKGEGDQYVDFLVKTLRPYINKNFRTKRCGKHNYIAGSSMGGLISLYAILKYPKKFGGAGVFSPALWIAPRIREAAEANARKLKGRIYFFAGQQESESMVPDMLSIFEILRRNSKADMTTVVRAEGRHSEATWRNEFPLFYQWLMR